MSELCVCYSGKLFIDCCDQFLNQQKIAESPEQLMRSRYSAYALGDYGEYLLQTWLPSQNKSLSVANLSLQTATWVELEVLNSSEQGAEGFVEFNALFLGENGEICTHHERSLFQKILGKWLYVGEEI